MALAAAVATAEVLHYLQQMCDSTSFQAQQAGAARLQALEGRKGFVPSLIEILQCSDNSFNTRFLGAICLKNNIDKCWTHRDRNTVLSEDEKSAVRMLTMHLLSEEEHRLALQNALLIARIARYDWPQHWPRLFEDLYGILSNPSSTWLQQRNALVAVHEVLVVLRSKCIAAYRRQLAEVAYEMLPAFVAHVEACMQQWRYIVVKVQSSSPCAELTARHLGEFGRHCTLSIRVICYLVMLSFKQHHNDMHIRNAINAIALLTDHCTDALQSLWDVLQTDADCAVPDRFAYLKHCEDSWFVCEYDADSTSSLSSNSDDSLVQISLKLENAVSLPIAQYLIISIGAVHQAAALCHLPLALLKHHCEAMADYVSLFLPVMWNVVTAEHRLSLLLPDMSRINAGYIIPLCQFFSLVLQSNPQPDMVDDDSVILTCNNYVREYVNESRFRQLFDMIQSNYLLFDIARSGEEWMEDAEEYFVKCQSESEGDSIVNAAQAVVCAMLDFRPELMEDLLRQAISAVEAQRAVVSEVIHYLSCVDSDDVVVTQRKRRRGSSDCSVTGQLDLFPIDLRGRVLQLDGLYTSMCMAPAQLSEAVGGATWLELIVGPLLTDLSTIRTNNIVVNVLRRRLLWVLTCWGYLLTAEQLGSVIDLVACYLDRSSTGCCADACVQLTAVECLCSLLNSSDMSADILEPLEQRGCRIISLSCSLACDDLKQSETQSIAINLVKEVMILCADKLKPHVPALMGHVLSLWNRSDAVLKRCEAVDDDDNNVEAPHRVTAMELMSTLVKLDRASSPGLGEFLHPILSYALSCSINTSYLVESGMNVWLQLVRNSTTYTYQLDDLFVTRLPAILSSDLLGAELEDIKLLANLLDSYVALGGHTLLCGLGGHVLANILGNLVCNVRPRAAVYVMKPLETMTLAVPSIAPAFLTESGLMTVLLRACAASYYCSSSAQHRHSDLLRQALSPFEEADVAIVAYLTVIATCVIHSVNHMRMAADALTQSMQLPCTGSDIYTAVFHLLIDKFDAAGYAPDGIWRKKIWCFALISLFPSPDEGLLGMLPVVLRLCADAIVELQTPEGIHKMMNLASILSTALSEEELELDYEESDADDGRQATKCDVLVDIFKHFLSQHEVYVAALGDVVFDRIEKQRSMLTGFDFNQNLSSQLDPSSLLILKQCRIFP